MNEERRTKTPPKSPTPTIVSEKFTHPVDDPCRVDILRREHTHTHRVEQIII